MDGGELHRLLNFVVAPRPICLTSTIDGSGRVNLSPFSFFNLFSVFPPVCVFSPSRRVRDGSTKHTLENVIEVAECVVNIVDYSMVQQMSLTSTEYCKEVNEFEKAGFTMLESELVRPPRVAEAKVQLECRVTKIVPLGMGAGAGNLVVAEILKVHVSEEVFGEDGQVDQLKLDQVGRLGSDWYCRMVPESLFRLEKPLSHVGIGVDALPKNVLALGMLSGNELGVLGGLEHLPTQEQMTHLYSLAVVREIYMESGDDISRRRKRLVELAQKYLVYGSKEMALRAVVLAGRS